MRRSLRDERGDRRDARFEKGILQRLEIGTGKRLYATQRFQRQSRKEPIKSQRAEGKPLAIVRVICPGGSDKHEGECFIGVFGDLWEELGDPEVGELY